MKKNIFTLIVLIALAIQNICPDSRIMDLKTGQAWVIIPFPIPGVV